MSLAGRSLARRSAVQAIYQWQVTGLDPIEIERQFIEEHGLGKGDLESFKELVHAVPRHIEEIDTVLRLYVDRELDDVDPVERGILRIGAYELLFKPELPYRVVLNEAIRFAKEFGSSQGYRFVNGILDRVAHHCRECELAAESRLRATKRKT